MPRAHGGAALRHNESMDEIDPVCGMDLQPELVVSHTEYEGDTYSFCSPRCKDEFERAPERFVAVRLPRR